MNIKEKVKLIVGSIEKNDNNNEFNYFEDLIPFYFADDKDFSIIKEKMDNLIKLMTEKYNEGTDAFEKFNDLDFEEEIWEII